MGKKCSSIALREHKKDSDMNSTRVINLEELGDDWLKFYGFEMQEKYQRFLGI